MESAVEFIVNSLVKVSCFHSIPFTWLVTKNPFDHALLHLLDYCPATVHIKTRSRLFLWTVYDEPVSFTSIFLVLDANSIVKKNMRWQFIQLIICVRVNHRHTYVCIIFILYSTISNGISLLCFLGNSVNIEEAFLPPQNRSILFFRK